MNIFYLDKDPKKCAEHHCDQHCVKMIIEYAQIMSTAHRVLDGEEYYRINKSNHKVRAWKLNDKREETLYQAGFYHHPCVIWTEESVENYNYLYNLFCALCDEFKKRYGKTHLTDIKLREILRHPPQNIPKTKFTTPALAMPDYCKMKTAIASYRNFYKKEKIKFAKWKNGEPDWL
ncbi:MAG: hypothetical protein OIF36_04890 [Alphaproteobacteria bacterium]|nr:hypothetical protein [Alphaproteobacteria bacterium]